MKLNTPGTDAAMLIARGGTLLILVGVFTLTDRILGLDRLWSIVATLAALTLWWRTDLVWKIGTRRMLDEQEQPVMADGHVAATDFSPMAPMTPLAARDRLQPEDAQGTAAIALDRLLATAMPGNDPSFDAIPDDDHLPSGQGRAGHRRDLIRVVPRSERSTEECR